MGITQKKEEKMTEGQEAQLTRVIMDQFRKSGHMNKSGVDRILARGNELATVLGPLFTRLGAEVTLIDSKLFEPITTVPVSATESFAAKDFFKESDQPNGIKFWFGSNFAEYFVDGEGKVEHNIPQAALNAHKLRKVSVNGPIISELGGESQAETGLVYMAELISKQPNGEEGVLLTNGWANIFYLRDCNNQLWAVDCYWYSGSRRWDVAANSVTSPGRWSAGSQFFSHGSLIS